MFPAHSFSGSELPGSLGKDNELCKLIKNMIKLTGKIECQDDDDSWGTGFVQKIRFKLGKCPCLICKGEVSEKKFAILTVSTVVHILDDSPDREDAFHVVSQKIEEVGMTVHYKQERFIQLYGSKLLETDKDLGIERDWCCLEFVTHKLREVKKLNTILTKYQELQGKVYQRYKDGSENLVVVVGYPSPKPNPNPKQISIGKITREYEPLKEIRDGQRWGRYYYDAETDHGCSGAPILILGQPISGFGYWFGHPHNHCVGVQPDGNDRYSSIGVEYDVGNGA
ncbi:unnamed protein product [Lymnaea stagnalis]|uniref:Uncharacterized protein n=1 Tax=Lymnaea stagnalis TaxID=6523 RepID=A0AAV2HVU5_LYMST